MEEIKKLLETWKAEKGSFIPNAPIYSMFIKELEDAIEKQEEIDKLQKLKTTRNISVYSNAEDERLDYQKDYVFHHFVSKRKTLIENIETGQLLEVHYTNFKFT